MTRASQAPARRSSRLLPPLALAALLACTPADLLAAQPASTTGADAPPGAAAGATAAARATTPPAAPAATAASPSDAQTAATPAAAPSTEPAAAPQTAGKAEPEVTSTADENGRTGGWRLADEDSPYLRQHADNPVNWFPWGEEAFDLARQLDWPIFISIGYSSCHWCHVMEHESFLDQDTADELNRHFVCIKVDREQRPDVDDRYMTAVQAMTGSGGWPLSAWLTPEGEPFYGGTYYPAKPRGSMPSFRQVLAQIEQAWDTDRQGILDAVKHNAPLFTRDLMPDPAAFDAPSELANAARALNQALDPTLGGLSGGRPQRFPPSQALSFLLRRARRDPALDLHAVTVTLDAMAKGGMHDHVGGGFHRYSTDAHWRVPHFEKMLYDNVQLAAVYAQAFAVTGEARQARVARNTLRWLIDDMRSPEGLYYSARDADSLPFDTRGLPLPGAHAEEGEVTTWTPDEVLAVLGEEDGTRFNQLYQITPAGNFERGRSIPRLRRTSQEIADDPGDGLPRGQAFLDWQQAVLARLRAARSARPQAFRDEKCLSAWNGLTLSGFATAASLLDDERLVAATAQLGQALLTRLTWREPAGTIGIHHQLFEGRASGTGDLADHAFVARGLLDAYACTGDPAFLAGAWELSQALLQRFEDPERGGFFRTLGEDPKLPGRGRELQDGSVPSSQSVALEVLIRLAPLDDSGRLMQAVDRAMGSLASLVGRNARAFPSLAIALDAYAGPLAEVVLAGDPDSQDYQQLFGAARHAFLPAELLVPDAERAAAALAGVGLTETPALLADRQAQSRQPTAWVCKQGTCLLPVHDAPALAGQWEFVLRP